MRLLENKVALITGASRGIGAAIALAMAEPQMRLKVSFCSSDQVWCTGGRSLSTFFTSTLFIISRMSSGCTCVLRA